MRTSSTIIVGALLMLGASACGSPARHAGVASAGGTASATASVTPGAQDGQRKALEFARCMRDNGVPNFPDPKFNDNGGVGIDTPDGADPQKVDAAMAKCKQYLPNGGQPQKADPKVVEGLRKYAQCMRDNGIEDFPDPTPDGPLIDTSRMPGSPGARSIPGFAAAMEACRDIPPSAGVTRGQ